jgi:hypothetical protein
MAQRSIGAGRTRVTLADVASLPPRGRASVLCSWEQGTTCAPGRRCMPPAAVYGQASLPAGLLLGLLVVFTYLVARFLASFLARVSPPPAAMAAPPEEAQAPLPVGELSLAELRQYDGSDTSKPLLLVRGM